MSDAPADGDHLVIPFALAGRTAPCQGCPDHAEHLRLRRLADCVCVCGRCYGFGVPLVFGALTGRWYHSSCFYRTNNSKDQRP